MAQFKLWFNDAVVACIYEPNACILATSNNDAVPSARVVLIKNFDKKGFCFFTNYLSQKGKELSQNPFASMVFFWPELHRQIRISGKVKKLNREESVAYFNSRPLGSKISATISPQSRIVKDENFLTMEFEKVKDNLNGKDPICPLHWGGYRLSPLTIEFWQGRTSRLHDRLLYTKGRGEIWKVERLAP